MKVTLDREDVEWVVNESGDIGVKIGEQFFFCYKGESYCHIGDKFVWRNVRKREVGETLRVEGYEPIRDDNNQLINPYSFSNSAEQLNDQVVCGDGEWRSYPPNTPNKYLPYNNVAKEASVELFDRHGHRVYEFFDRLGRRINNEGNLINEKGEVIDTDGNVIEYDTEADSSDETVLQK